MADVFTLGGGRGGEEGRGKRRGRGWERGNGGGEGMGKRREDGTVKIGGEERAEKVIYSLGGREGGRREGIWEEGGEEGRRRARGEERGGGGRPRVCACAMNLCACAELNVPQQLSVIMEPAKFVLGLGCRAKLSDMIKDEMAEFCEDKEKRRAAVQKILAERGLGNLVKPMDSKVCSCDSHKGVIGLLQGSALHVQIKWVYLVWS